MNGNPQRRLVATLGAVILIVSVMQTGFVPIVAAIATQLHVSPTAASWSVTANVLTAAAATPLIGRLADLFNKKTVMLSMLALILAGSLLGALTSSLPLLVLGRAVQGTSFALYPVAISILREDLPGERLIRGIAALSMALGLGGALGLLFTAFLMPEGADYHRIFWLFAAMTVAVIAPVFRVVSNRPSGTPESVDWVGGAVLAGGLSLLLLAITQGSDWGWARTIAAVSVGLAVLGFWRHRNRRQAHPLVAPEILSRRPVLLANVAGFLIGMGSYFSLLGLSTFAGYQFGTSVQGISLQVMLPGAIAGTVTALAAGRLIERFGARPVLVMGALTGVIGFAALAGWHTARWELVLAAVLTNVYIGLAYGALPALIVGDVESGDTAVANSLNGIFRKVGGATGAAVVGAILGPGGGGAPAAGAFLAVFVAGAITATVAVLLVCIGRVRATDRIGWTVRVLTLTATRRVAAA